MPVQQVTLQNIPELDAGIVLAFHQHLRRAAQDCEDRPGDRKARTVSIEVIMTPVQDQRGECASVNIDLQCIAKIPAYRTRTYSVGVRKNGILVFNPDSPDNPNQSTLISEPNEE